MKIYIDFDRTLFDCDRFIEDFHSLLEEYNIKIDDFIKYQNQFKRVDFNPYNTLDLMSKEKDINLGIYAKIDKLIKKSSNYLFPDAIPFLEYLKKKGYTVIILTSGNYDYQMNKINNSNISTYYDDIIVTSKHKGELDFDYSNSIFIDDRKEEIDSIINKNPKEVIWIQRKGINNKLDIKTITSLNELINNI